MAYKAIDKLIFKEMKKKKLTQKATAKFLGVRPQTVHKYQIFGFPDKHLVKMIKLLKVPSKKVVEAIREDFRI